MTASCPEAGPKTGPDSRQDISVEACVAGVLAGDRAIVARAITLVESHHPRHRALAAEVLTALLPHSGTALRVGVTGAPGVGKSTFIEAFGTMLTQAGHKVAVLAVDPTSTRTGGSILGDKTRMQELGRNRDAFIRPSPTSGALGGVARATRESMLVCEAAGFDAILVETVGVGQSEIAVAEMVDFFLVLMLPGAGDELQGIKKGVLEIADMIVFNKADGDQVAAARRSAVEYRRALQIVAPTSADWHAITATCSALTGDGLPDIHARIEAHRAALAASGAFHAKRRDQRVRWMWSMIRDRLMLALERDPAARTLIAKLEAEVAADRLPPSVAADRALAAFAPTAFASDEGPSHKKGAPG